MAAPARDRSAPSAVDRRPPTGRWWVPLLLGVAATVLTFLGVAGVGDAPSPHDPAADVGEHFVRVRDDVLAAAPAGYAGAVAVVLLAAHVARSLRALGEGGAGMVVAAGGATLAAYLVGLQVAYTALSYEVARASDDAAKALFVVTIMAIPVAGAGTAALLGGYAYGDRRARLGPRWLVAASALGAVVAAVALGSYARSGALSPDVQQQIVIGIAMYWALIAGAALAWRARAHGRRRRRSGGVTTTGRR